MCIKCTITALRPREFLVLLKLLQVVWEIRRFGLDSFSLAATNEIPVGFFSSRYWDVSLPEVCILYCYKIIEISFYWVSSFGDLRIVGCLAPPRSISPPRCVLHRLSKPRHPPYALKFLFWKKRSLRTAIICCCFLLYFISTCPPTHPQKDPHWKWLCDGILMSKNARTYDRNLSTKKPAFLRDNTRPNVVRYRRVTGSVVLNICTGEYIWVCIKSQTLQEADKQSKNRPYYRAVFGELMRWL